MTNSVLSARTKMRNDLQPIAPTSSHAIANALLAAALLVFYFEVSVNRKLFCDFVKLPNILFDLCLVEAD